MKNPSKLKIINDPIYGFITIPGKLLFQLINDPYFQRLRRISQMGLSYLVFPGAHHTRFHHALGAMSLMQNAVQTLCNKGIKISEEEKEALYVAILLHDIGHGPFSHAMENSIVEGVNHEHISIYFMEALNRKFEGKLTLAISIFKDEYDRKFLHQLVSGQLDMDRLDYLRRDSFYTGVPEGNINSQRLTAMLNVKNDNLVVDYKGIYSVEKFLIARRLMYWQVYLHKTGVVAEQLLLRLLKRAKQITQQGINLPASSALSFFLKNKIDARNFSEEVLDTFAKLDDTDIIAAMKVWSENDDFVLRNLSLMILNRNLLKIKVRSTHFSEEKILAKKENFMKKYTLSLEEASFFVFTGAMENQAYRTDRDNINMLTKSGKIVDVAAASDQLNLEALSKTVIKYYLCFPKNKY
ncbi:HD domain-containing protein [Aequorivita echinoideorum]|uniref:HD domain-containing protein n=1 Tax=Aequorivita echinoideorum TaxID=1549647 RepID=A0ABS5S6B2_9FLAO|nr:HD domain-containing protein [Aequorivita echinoideorum]MBT0608747.1 HD domain-containing protein [Aequorivita echinoideorum]